jgi:hypothetical protein
MKILELNEIAHLLPADVDCECVSLCNTLNRLPGLMTYESCCGHGWHPFWVWFRCDDIDTLSRLGRAVDRRYSDGNWEIVLDTKDGDPRGCFLLRSTSTLQTDELRTSLAGLEENILYWFQDDFDKYFNQDMTIERPDVELARSIIDYTVEQLKSGN